jgi:chromosomal replication initiation ATPase DnaA
MADIPKSEAIQVIVRIRPGDEACDAGLLGRGDESTVILIPPQPEANQDTRAGVRPCHGDGAAKKFKIDRVFSPAASQKHIYEVVRPFAVSVTHGYNATIFAYGHTGSGKTHTMTGTTDDPGEPPRK